jgi:NADH:ubiquinone oxidoreductase subunit B-like Fe-S oxidoreductase
MRENVINTAYVVSLLCVFVLKCVCVVEFTETARARFHFDEIHTGFAPAVDDF